MLAGDCIRTAAGKQVHAALYLQVPFKITCPELLKRGSPARSARTLLWRRKVSREVSPAVAPFPPAEHSAAPE